MDTTGAQCDRLSKVAGRMCNGELLLMSPDRIAYVGLDTAPSWRMIGAIMVYASLRNTLRFCCQEGIWTSHEMLVVPPYVPHKIISDERRVSALLIEPETVATGSLPEFLRSGRIERESPEVLSRLKEGFAYLRTSGLMVVDHAVSIDSIFFSQPLAPSKLNNRIEQVCDQIKNRPCDNLDAESCAKSAGLSVSRFLHLFKEETGTTFRRFRMWRRARTILGNLNNAGSLTDMAMEGGYPDATHFSHSMRKIFGTKPTDMVNGFRNLSLSIRNERAAEPLVMC